MPLPTAQEVEKVLEERVKPYLTSHNGGIRLKSISPDGAVRIVFLGACTNCPSMGDTLLNTVEATLIEAFPDAGLHVIAVNDVDDELWSLAKSILRK